MKEKWKFEKDQRQYQRMQAQLKQFTEGNLGLGGLIGDLDFLVSALECPNVSWQDEFRSECGTLETIHALSLSRCEQGKPANISDQERELIDRAIDALNRLLRDQRISCDG